MKNSKQFTFSFDYWKSEAQNIDYLGMMYHFADE